MHVVGCWHCVIRAGFWVQEREEPPRAGALPPGCLELLACMDRKPFLVAAMILLWTWKDLEILPHWHDMGCVAMMPSVIPAAFAISHKRI